MRGARAVSGTALALTAGLAAAALADGIRTAPGVTILERGLICAPPEGGRREAPDTAFGWIHVPDRPLDIRLQGAVAPARLGTGFGLRFSLDRDDPVLVRHVVTHPPMTDAGITEQAWESLVLPGLDEAVFFQFDIEEELVTGPWAFAAYDETGELYRVGFSVVPPATVPHLDELCTGGDLFAFSRTIHAAAD